ncbi:MAG: flagellar basal body rod protein FlgB [Gammaproteobacteria bacterium]|nr:flagellar basal body rod protein FlgB [Gammaproteobacteria bacterium]NND39046.1 flagellar basal body rod protein FlgB [Pseudomonadales bacterium]NNM12135.1 flagellar basal body rod protein FlgB [Pseudomonadales bacterium]
MAAISFSNALGVHEYALNLRVARAEVLANNLANVDTPGFKARDVDFRELMRQAKADGELVGMRRTDEAHLSANGLRNDQRGEMPMLYRKPLQTGIDGNTVDAQYEAAEFAKNAMDFSASFRLLNGKFTSMSKAMGSNR